MGSFENRAADMILRDLTTKAFIFCVVLICLLEVHRFLSPDDYLGFLKINGKGDSHIADRKFFQDECNLKSDTRTTDSQSIHSQVVESTTATTVEVNEVENDTSSVVEIESLLQKKYKANRQKKNIVSKIKASHNGKTEARRIPNVIVIGVKKCGTGAMRVFLNMHPRVKSAGEVYYFNRHPTNGVNWYKNQMPMSFIDDLVFEKTPSYFYDMEVLKRIKDYQKILKSQRGKNLKLIFVLCDPTRRIYSDYLHSLRFSENGTSMEGFIKEMTIGLDLVEEKMANAKKGKWYDDLVVSRGVAPHYAYGMKFIMKSCYSIFVEAWYEKFKKNKEILFVDSSKLITNPGEAMVEIQEFLETEVLIDENNFFLDKAKGFNCAIDLNNRRECMGSSKGRSSKGEVPEELKVRMRNVLKPCIADFEKIQGTSFSHWD